MKKILLATTILGASAGFAAAEVSVSGDARMGVAQGYNSVTKTTATTFSSRVRIKFSGSGTTDGGLAFGGSFRAADANGAGAGIKGETFISGAFGRIAMGDVDSGDAAAVGQLASVGYTGLGSTNSINYAADGFDLFGLPALAKGSKTIYFDTNDDPIDFTEVHLDPEYSETYTASTVVAGGSAAKVLYTYTAGGLTIDASAGQISNGPTDLNSYGLGVAYTTGGLTLAAGYGSNEFGFVTTLGGTGTSVYDSEDGPLAYTEYNWTYAGATATVSDGSVTDATISATYVMGDTTIKAIYQDKQADAKYQLSVFDTYNQESVNVGAKTSVSAEATSMGLSVVHKMGALSLKAFGVSTDLTSDIVGGKADVSFTRSGIGASYDLGGGASVTAGAVRVEAPNLKMSLSDLGEVTTKVSDISFTAYDIGVNFSF